MGMKFTRKEHEGIVIEDDKGNKALISLSKINPHSVDIYIEASPVFLVDRDEVYYRKKKEISG